MNVHTTVILAALALLIAGCTGTPPPGGEMAAADSDNLRCKTIIKTGTRLGTKVCKSEAAWEQDARTSKEATEDIQRSSTHGPAAQGG